MPRVLVGAIVCAAFAIASVAQPGPRALRVDGRRLVTADGRPFHWRGVTAFRLIDHLADNRARDADAYLDWARATGFNIVRVLTRIDTWADLSAADGQRLLPDLLARAAARGLYVEAVATVNSGVTPYDWRAHARRIAEICAKTDNCLYEFANEPGHPTQASELHDMGQVDRLASDATRDLPGLVWTAGPSWDSDVAVVPSGAYVVRHLERSGPPLRQIARLRELADLSARVGKFVVSDEPTGADEQDGARTGRQRWNDPDVFFAMGALCRGFKLGCTFHLQDGLATVVPGPVQKDSARAFINGWNALRVDGAFVAADAPGSPIAAMSKDVVAAFVFPLVIQLSSTGPVVVALHEVPLDAKAVSWKPGVAATKPFLSERYLTAWNVASR